MLFWILTNLSAYTYICFCEIIPDDILHANNLSDDVSSGQSHKSPNMTMTEQLTQLNNEIFLQSEQESSDTISVKQKLNLNNPRAWFQVSIFG